MKSLSLGSVMLGLLLSSVAFAAPAGQPTESRDEVRWGEVVVGLELRLVLPKRAKVGERVDAQIELRNAGQKTIQVTSYGVSLGYPDPALAEPGPWLWFEITREDGGPVPYTGPIRGRGSEVNLTVLEPGKSRQLLVRHLEKKYAIGEPGAYKCRAKVKTKAVKDDELLWEGVLVSKVGTLRVLPEREVLPEPEVIARSLFKELERVGGRRSHYREILDELFELGEAARHILPEVAAEYRESRFPFDAVARLSDRLKDKSALPVFLQRLRTLNDRETPGNLGLWIARISRGEGVRKMVQLLRDKDQRIRKRALRGMAYANQYFAINAVPAVAEVLDETADPVVKQQLIAGIRDILREQATLPSIPEGVLPFAEHIFRWVTAPEDELTDREKEIRRVLLDTFGKKLLEKGIYIDTQGKNVHFQVRDGKTVRTRIYPNRKGWLEVKIDPSGAFALMTWRHWITWGNERTIRVLFRFLEGRWELTGFWYETSHVDPY